LFAMLGIPSSQNAMNLLRLPSRLALPFLSIGVTAGLLAAGLSSCNVASSKVTLASGTAGGYYSRLSRQVKTSAESSVGIGVQEVESQGSLQNLQRLLDREVDFALVQLDVAGEAMQQGKVKAIALLANEYIHVITRRDAGVRQFTDLQGKRVAVGTAGSGIRFTADRLLQAAKLQIYDDASDFDGAMYKLKNRQVDAVIYVGSLGASGKLRQYLSSNPNFQIAQVPTNLVNYLTVRDPGFYRSAVIPIGTYNPLPAIPPQNVQTLSTATVLVTRPDVNQQQVGLLTWAILDTSRQYTQFYPELQGAEAQTLLQRGLFYIHPAAAAVYAKGDPRNAWMRYWEENNDLQAGVFIILVTSGTGLFLQHWRRERSKKLIATTTERIAELRTLLPHEAQQALKGIEELGQEHRVMFIDGLVTSDVYEQVQQKTQMFADQCRSLLEGQRKQFILDTLLLLDDWQATLQTNPQEALRKLGQIKQQYREMLLADQVDIEAYIELMELTLISVMTLAPKGSTSESNSTLNGLHGVGDSTFNPSPEAKPDFLD
jgi:uncharacterized protein